ncbi:MAG: isoprenylcysteine carboxylmethyltransferase family protein [Acidobacteria bacterium]|nr:isoprenylcysteine carboxylmethyltransferase family protein [Acidobacteriota bacterium]
MNLLKTLIFTLVVPATVTIYAPRWLVAPRAQVHADAAHLVGLLPIIFGACVYFWCAWDFATHGRGSPAPIAPPKELVARGLYRHVRNPMYVGVAAILLGESLLFASLALLWYAVAVVFGFNLFVLLYEEPTLRRKFGDSYERYCREVPRWIPRLRAGD